MDFAKAFDKVPHRRLLHKLEYYGIRGSTHKWINSWLSGRTQQVVLDGQASDPVPVLSGVPQGSVLGPVLFLLFINDLPDNIRSSVCLLAEECVLYRNIGITHVFSCINICRIPRMLFEHEADRPSVQHHPRDPASVNAMKQTCVIVILAYFTLFKLSSH